MTNSRTHSADAVFGWLNHYHRMLRWRDRSLTALKMQTGEEVDVALAFFVWCFSFRDWLRVEPSLSSKELEDFVSNEPYWGFCRDIALRAKHYDLSSPSKDAEYGMSRSFDPFHKILGTKPVTWHVWIDGQKVEMETMIRSLSKGWQDFIETRFEHPSWSI